VLRAFLLAALATLLVALVALAALAALLCLLALALLASLLSLRAAVVLRLTGGNNRHRAQLEIALHFATFKEALMPKLLVILSSRQQLVQHGIYLIRIDSCHYSCYLMRGADHHRRRDGSRRRR
jgi:hypothetical protein